MIVPPGKLDRRGASTELVVLLHAYTMRAASLRHVRAVVAARHPDADLLAPDLPLGVLSMARPAEIIAGLLMDVDRAWDGRDGGYQRVILVGHSIGALFARKLYVCACGENPEAPFEPELARWLGRRRGRPLDRPRPWAARVERIVLLAGTNRGWSISHHLSLANALLWSAGVAVGKVLMLVRGRRPLIFTARRGAPFITQLRIQWLMMRRLATTGRKPVGGATTIQLLGTIDDMVSPEDNVDLVAGRDFVYLDVPRSGHANVIDMDDSEAGRARRGVLDRALTASRRELEAEQMLPADTALVERPEVTEVVFVVHGIRDEGHWTQKIARRVIAEGRRHGRVIASETSTYGYFPMLSFLWPAQRRAKVEWLMDQYAEALATYPNATFSFVGHSNGTYLLARALQEYPSCRFKRVVFAGSVVRRQFDWSRHVPAQVEAVVNYVATADWVVAFFPKALQILHVQDLGSAGHDGFARGRSRPLVLQLDRYVVGGHSAAVQEAMWDAIARFIVRGEVVAPPAPVLSDHQAWWVRYPARVAPLLWVIIAGLLVWIFVALLGLPLAEWQKTLILAAFVATIWLILTRV